MRLASFEVETAVGPVRRVGVVDVDRGEYVDVTAGYAAVLAENGVGTPVEAAESLAPPSMQAFLTVGQRAFDAARDARDYADDHTDASGPDGATIRYAQDEVRLLSPLPRPNSIRDFMAFEEHVTNSLGDVPDVWYELPVYYKGNRNAIVHPGESLVWPQYTEQLDYELEIAAVVGKRGSDIDAREADEYIAGYTVFNDFSARDVQLREMAGRLGPTKGKDFANAFGPYLVTPDAINVESATMRATVNGDVWSEGTPGEMYHTFADIVEYVSQDETLYPGDILGSGTVGRGCGLELGQWIESGDTIALAIEGIGVLENRVVERSDN